VKQEQHISSSSAGSDILVQNENLTWDASSYF